MFQNPFNPGSGSPPPYLAGRENELATFKRNLKLIVKGQIHNIILTGLRGTGKTVLLNEFNRICFEQKFFPIKRLQFSQKYCDPLEFDTALKYDMSSAVASLSIKKKVTQKLKRVGEYLKPKSLGVPGTFYYEPSYQPRTIPFENHLEDYLSNNWEIFKKKGFHGVVFLFDEFHFVTDLKKKKQFVLGDFISAINELQNKDFKYFLVLTGLPRLPLNIKESRSYSERMFRTIELGNLSKDDAKLAISKPLKKSPYSFHTDLINTIVDDTGQYPYFIQFYCREILNNISKKRIGVSDYKLIKSIILKQLESDFFEPRIESLSNEEERLLISMAKIKTKDMKFSDILNHSKMKKPSLPAYLDRLEKKGLVFNHKYGIYRFSLPMLRDYILRKYV